MFAAHQVNRGVDDLHHLFAALQGAGIVFQPVAALVDLAVHKQCIRGQPVLSLEFLLQIEIGYFQIPYDIPVLPQKRPCVVIMRGYICVNGISKAPFEAEHAALTGVSTNTNHTGYYGEGFVEQFAENGDAVAFTVYEDAEAEKSVVIRYSAGTEDAQRSISVNGETVRISLPKTQDWDTWSEISVPVHVVAGRNTINICYNEGDFAGINLDCIRIE